MKTVNPVTLGEPASLTGGDVVIPVSGDQMVRMSARHARRLAYALLARAEQADELAEITK